MILKKIFVNLKRFDIGTALGGVNRTDNLFEWSHRIVKDVLPSLAELKAAHDVEFTIYFPEAHILPALSALKGDTNLAIGCQSVYRQDTTVGGNFGAFTSHRTANSMKQLGVTSAIIGHLEERLDKKGMMTGLGVDKPAYIDELFNQEIEAAQAAGLEVLYCIGETADERAQGRWQDVLKQQLEVGLKGRDLESIVIAYEPVWAIGVGKQPPTTEEVAQVVQYIKSLVPGIEVIYGGGLKQANAQALASIEELDGGLIALTRFEGEIGFYPEEFIEISRLFLNAE